MISRLKIHVSAKKIILAFIILTILVGSLVLVNSPLISYEAKHSYWVKDARNRIVFIIPGAGETEDKFRTIEGYYTDVGITPVFIVMDWRIWHIKDFDKNGSKEIEKAANIYPGRNFYFFGFSFGAVVALNNAEKFKSKGTILCSLSPLFQSDITLAPSLMKKMINLINFPLPNYKSIPEETAVFLYGDHDNSMIRSHKIVKIRESIYQKSKFEIIKGAKHDITGTAYLEQIQREIYKLKEDDKNE